MDIHYTAYVTVVVINSMVTCKTGLRKLINDTQSKLV